MKPDCPNCQTGICYHIHDSKRIELEDFKARIEILESAVDMLEERLSRVMDTQYIEPYILPARFRDIANAE